MSSMASEQQAMRSSLPHPSGEEVHVDPIEEQEEQGDFSASSVPHGGRRRGRKQAHDGPGGRGERSKNMAKKDTKRLLLWKVVLCLTILGTATAVLTMTYRYLKESEDSAYKQSVSSISTRDGNADDRPSHY